jgi:WD40 repeat protein
MDWLAAISIDTYIRIQSENLTPLNYIAGATQVKFNRKNQYLLASAHDKNVIIWDIRVSVFPYCFRISYHMKFRTTDGLIIDIITERICTSDNNQCSFH